MGIARNIARLIPNGSGLLPNANIEAVAASKLTGTVSDSQIAGLTASKLSGVIPDANAPSGSVIQVVQSVLTAQVSSSATSYTNIGLSASITPTSSSNRILAIANIGMVNTGGNAGSFLAIFRGSTILAQGDANGSRSRTMSGSMYADMTNSGLPMTMIYLDSPSTTSSTTYDIRGANLESSTAWFVNRSRANDNISYGFTSVSTLVLMEIAA